LLAAGRRQGHAGKLAVRGDVDCSGRRKKSRGCFSNPIRVPKTRDEVHSVLGVALADRPDLLQRARGQQSRPVGAWDIQCQTLHPPSAPTPRSKQRQDSAPASRMALASRKLYPVGLS